MDGEAMDMGVMDSEDMEPSFCVYIVWYDRMVIDLCAWSSFIV